MRSWGAWVLTVFVVAVILLAANASGGPPGGMPHGMPPASPNSCFPDCFPLK